MNIPQETLSVTGHFRKNSLLIDLNPQCKAFSHLHFRSDITHMFILNEPKKKKQMQDVRKASLDVIYTV